ncbi:MAG: SDR family oxidoreductase [Polyangiaceae bacterium]
MKGKVCIVTGSNTGIGKETARGLAKEGATVILACRDMKKAEAAQADIVASTGNKAVHAMRLNLGDKAQIRAFAKEFAEKYGRLDVLVNNAGLWPTSRSTTADGLETTFGVNHVGTALLTQELLPLLKASAPSRVVVLSSKLHYSGKMDWEDLQFERRKYSATTAYNQSKLANVLFTKALARRLEGTGVTVNAVHPGVVATELARDYPAFLVKIFHLFLLTPEQGAACSLHVATSPELSGVTGEYFEKSRVKGAAKAALDEEAQERLWKLTEQLAA